MKLENVQKGTRAKNYPELCRLLDETPRSGGNSKKAHIEDMSQYFDFKRDGQAYIIEEIFNPPRQRNDARQRYLQYIEPILMNYLYQHGDTHGVTWNTWYQRLGMVDSKFYNMDYREETREFWNIPSFSLFYLTNIVSRKNREILTSALSNMQKRQLITYNEVWHIISIDGWGMNASPSSADIIERFRQEAMHEMGYDNLSQIFLSPKRYEEFNNIFHTKIRNVGRWRHVYKALDIEAKSDICNLYMDIDVDLLKKTLNREICGTIRKAANDVFDRNLDMHWNALDDDLTETPTQMFSLPPRFAWDADLLVEYLMRI